MGRPWWYDSYWEKESRQRRKGFWVPKDPIWIWSAIFLISFLMTWGNGSFHFSITAWVLGFVYHLCRILSLVIIIRSLLSWFTVSLSNPFIILLNEVSNPILRPVRRIVPRLAMFDIAPMVAIVILYFIPVIISAILF
ncbi:YggT family protein [Chloroflexota bacterium]